MTDTDFIPLLLVLGGFALLWDTRRDHARVRLAVTLDTCALLNVGISAALSRTSRSAYWPVTGSS